ncbi:hypothetical protein BC829DRAFT_424058 [Chytridium lagenaria]|nr:hypothetical protein BC829DRAFT_424058 [Chytridium lagenaria]
MTKDLPLPSSPTPPVPPSPSPPPSFYLILTALTLLTLQLLFLLPSSPRPTSHGYTRPRVVASLSTFGHRLAKVHATVESLWNQTRRPDVMYLHVPERIERNANDASKRDFQKSPQNSTKLLGSLLVEKDPSTIIITIDDDTSYHPDLVKVLVGAIEMQNTAIPCIHCEVWDTNDSKGFEGEGFCDGWGPRLLGWRIGGVPDGCRLHDDVYVSGWARQHGYRPLW